MVETGTPPSEPVWWAVTHGGKMPGDMRLFVKAQTWFEARSKLQRYAQLSGKEIVQVSDTKLQQTLEANAEADSNTNGAKKTRARPRRRR